MPDSTFIIYKPYGFLSQFTKEHEAHKTLAELNFNFPKDAYPIGRLDADSEGLLIISNNKPLTARVLAPEKKLKKTYWVQVERDPEESQLNWLRNGVEINIKGRPYRTKPAQLRKLNNEAHFLPKRIPPIRERKHIPTRWVEIQITEGKNRQIRKMFAKIGYPVLRLVRVGIGNVRLYTPPLNSMQVGQIKKLEPEWLF